MNPGQYIWDVVPIVCVQGVPGGRRFMKNGACFAWVDYVGQEGARFISHNLFDNRVWTVGMNPQFQKIVVLAIEQGSEV